ncbi:helicase C-terminal domain-containing protein [Arthrobacter sp.]|uniref:ATP-dependent DNA helicase n=1 Tax=Arthrobacter sp. TaxID=1667 RepID=UPI003395AD74
MTDTRAPAGEALRLLDVAVRGMGGQHRAGQHEMAAKVAEAFDRRQHLLVQAGTGTGKSLAYLIPLMVQALGGEKPAIVSTATLALQSQIETMALQSQIVKRDLPRLMEAVADELPRPLDVALLKGRNNYVCLHKLAGGFPDEDAPAALFSLGEDAVPHPAPAGGGASAGAAGALGKEVVRLREWAQETETGDRDELVPGVSDRAWRQVSVGSMECLGAQKCPLAAECFSELARGHAAEADIVITNHAMLAINAFEGVAVLPDYDVVVIDEAHELQDRVTSAVAGQLSAALVRTAASTARKHTGISVEPLNSAAGALEDVLQPLPSGLLASGLREEQELVLVQLREAARAALSDSKPEGSGAADGGRQMARSRLSAVLEMAERLLSAADSREVIWATRPSTYGESGDYAANEDQPATLNIAPLSVASRLREGLFDEHTVVLTSATLSVGGTFDAVAGSLGLLGAGAPAYTSADVGSPFDYPRQGVLYVASHLPKPGRGTSTEQLDELEELLRASRGGALGLFSSRRAAEEAAAEMRKRTELTILCQGESSMAALVRQFADEPDTCLFGTMTLWQGVDVPGEACRLVVIDRIPFPRPDDPLTTARTRSVAQAGGNGFMTVSATHAAVRLAQGAGRLIRAANDKGVVAVLDSRLATARYGTFLRSALPPFWSTKDGATARQILERLAAAAA